MSTSVTEARDAAIIRALSSPMTMDQLRSVLGVNIHTLRRSMARLQQSQIIVPTGQVVDKKPTYVVKNNKPMPEVYNKKLNIWVSAIDVQKFYASNPAQFQAGMQAARYSMDAMNELLMLAQHRKNGTVTDAECAKELEQIRNNLKAAIFQLNTNADMCQQMLANPTWWSPESLVTVTDDPAYDDQKVFERYSRILQERQV